MPAMEDTLVRAHQLQLDELLQNMFNMALIDWVHDFLFQTDPSTHATILRSPLQTTHALIMSTSASQLADGPNSAPNFDIFSNWLLVPAFGIGSISVGIVVESITRRSSTESTIASNNRFVKYVRSDTDGTTLCICDDTDADVLEVEYLSYASPARSIRAYCRFARPLLQYLRVHRGSRIDVRELRRSLLNSVLLREDRKCAVCNTLERNCNCKFTFAQPRHALDFQHTARNTLPLLGDFRGRGLSTTFKLGVEIEHSEIATLLSAKSGASGGLKEKMIFWAIQNCLAQQKTSPLLLEMPSAGKIAPSKADRDMTDVYLRDVSHESGSVSTKKEIQERKDGSCVAKSETCSENGPDPNRSVFETQPASFSVGSANNNARPSTQRSSNAAVDKVITPSVPKRAWVPIAPALMLRPDRVNGSVREIQSAYEVPKVEQYSSAERRKILKREAAARSNARRRHLVKLQRAIDDQRKKVSELKAREKELIEENQSLKSKR